MSLLPLSETSKQRNRGHFRWPVATWPPPLRATWNTGKAWKEESSIVKGLESSSDDGEVNSGQFQADRVPMSPGPGQHSLVPFLAFTIAAPTFDVIIVVGARPRAWTSIDVSLLTPRIIWQWAGLAPGRPSSTPKLRGGMAGWPRAWALESLDSNSTPVTESLLRVLSFLSAGWGLIKTVVGQIH